MCASPHDSVLRALHLAHHGLGSIDITMATAQNNIAVAAEYCYCDVLQSLLTARWPLELHQNKHSCIKQLQDVYLSADSFGSIVGSADLRGKMADDTEFLNLSQVGGCSLGADKTTSTAPAQARVPLIICPCHDCLHLACRIWLPICLRLTTV